MQNVSKRTILWIVPILIIGIFWYFYGPKEEITDNEYITYIKESTLDDSSIKVGEAFSNSCEEEKWVYFQTQRNQHVVEFMGNCPSEKTLKKVNLQFIVNDHQDGFEVNVLLLDNVQQSQEQRDVFIRDLVSL